jgi:Ca2+-binding EF-hand superfamily protein/ribosomal protein L32
MPPPSWKDCPHCHQKFAARSLDIHVKRCREHKDVQRENEAFREARYMKSYSWATPLPSWEACSNCGERYSPIAMAPHIKRCKRLRPNTGNHAPVESGGPFEGMWGVDTRPLPVSIIEKLGNSLKSLVSGEGDGQAGGGSDGAAPQLSDEERARLKELFDHFDVNGDGALSQAEHGMLLFNCFPERVLDAKELLAEFKTVDADGSGLVDFGEFLRYYGELLLPHATRHFEEASDMFFFFDVDQSGKLERHEFLSLLNNVFPAHCEENERVLAAEFPTREGHKNRGAITFTEFCAYYDRLCSLYANDETKPISIKELKASASAAGTVSSPVKLRTPAAAVSAGEDLARSAAAKQPVKPGKVAKSAKGASRKAAAAAPAAPMEPREVDEARLAEIDGLLSAGLITPLEYGQKRATLFGAAASSGAPPPPEDLVQCEGCGETFLAHLRPKHQRACTAVTPAKKKSVKFAERNERPLPKPRESYDDAIESVAFADNGSNSFVRCTLCDRSFFPDRLAIHQRVCKGGGGGGEGAGKVANVGGASTDELDAARFAELDALLSAGLITQDEYDLKKASMGVVEVS